MHCYCAYCASQKGKPVAETLEAMGAGKALLPRIIQRKWIKGKAYEEVHDYLPGYVFLYTEEPIPDFLPIWGIPSLLRLLGDPECGFELYGSDRAFAEMLLDADGTIGILKAVEVGNRVLLDKALFGDFEGEIVRLDRGRKRAEIEFDFDGKKQRVWCGVEIIKKVVDEEE